MTVDRGQFHSYSLEQPVHLVHRRSRHVVDKKSEKNNQQNEQTQLNNDPLPVLPENVFERLHWVHDPEERRVRTAEEEE